MKRKFRAYYRPTEDEKRSAMKDAYIIFDTNALIDILRLSPDLSDKTLGIIEKHKDSIRIPQHVAWEYHRHVLATSAEMFAMIENARRNFDFEPLNKALKSQLTDEGNSNRFPKDCLNRCSRELLESFKKIQTLLQNLEEYYRLSFINQGIQTQVSELLGDCLMDGLSQEYIVGKKAEWQARYDKKTPPGYKDAGKNDNQFGDLIIWNEILDIAKKDNKNIVFVSNDLKEDWLLRLAGKTWGPRIELLEEFDNYTGHTEKMLLIYSLDQFLKQVDEDDIFNEADLSIISEQSQIVTDAKKHEADIKQRESIKSILIDSSENDWDEERVSGNVKSQKISFEDNYTMQVKDTIKSTIE